ncbi:MAG: hypothetical protein JST86_11755 [Bacteroidetes bacterium]|nr:hypothetical protein [Bacteroidota bacterium]
MKALVIIISQRKLYQRLLIISLLFITSISTKAQEVISGIWEGKFFTPAAYLGQPRLVVEIFNVNDSTYSGITHLYYEGNKYEHYKMRGWYSKKDSVLIFTEAETIAVDLGMYGNCLGTYQMIMRKTDNGYIQVGYWEANIKGCSSTSQIWLQKRMPVVVKPPEPPTPPAKKPVKPEKPAQQNKDLKKRNNQPVIVPEPKPTVPVMKDESVIKPAPTIMPAKIAQRETDLQSLLEIADADKDSIRVDVYDNGEIDGDSVSVFLDNTQLINKKMITAKPLTFYVSLDKRKNPISHLRLVAESLGSIPPCTALMIVTTKSKRYEVRLSSNFSKNATVELFLKE